MSLPTPNAAPASRQAAQLILGQKPAGGALTPGTLSWERAAEGIERNLATQGLTAADVATGTQFALDGRVQTSVARAALATGRQEEVAAQVELHCDRSTVTGYNTQSVLDTIAAGANRVIG